MGDPARGVEQDNWDLTFERFAVERLEGGSDTAERLALAIAQLHGAVVEPPEPVLPPLRRAELCWRAHRLLLDWRERNLSFPDWLDVLEQQLVLSGAQLWRERVGLEEEAGARALELFERLGVLFDPCPAWIRLACLELRQLSSEQLCQELETALEDEEGDQVLLEKLALCCDRCCREALERGDWGLAMERQTVAERTLHRLDEGHPHGSQARWEGYAALVIAIVDRLKPVLIGEAGHSLPDAVRARLYDRVERMLKRYHALPIEPPEWLAVVELQLLQEGAQLWCAQAGHIPGASERALALFQQLAEQLHHCPPWVIQELAWLGVQLTPGVPKLGLIAREQQPPVVLREGWLELNLLGWLDDQQAEEMEPLVAGFIAGVELACELRPGGMTSEPEMALAGAMRSLSRLWEKEQTLPNEQLERLRQAGQAWRTQWAERGRQTWSELPELQPEGMTFLISLEAAELLAVQQTIWPAHGQPVDPQRQAWAEAVLGPLTVAALWGEAVLWAPDEEAGWVALPLLQALSEGACRGPDLVQPPSTQQLRQVLGGQQVVLVAPGAAALSAKLSQEGLRGVDPPESLGVQASLAALVETLIGLHAVNPIDWLVADCGVLRLPLLLELHRRKGVKGMAIDQTAALFDNGVV
ncbi:hypothetical protein WH5701_12428 [Synechococcus sp. WH 5701]|nr:hypothetical protein WH5701_12428 [Synechococcus sp. WH 5701]